MLIWAWPSISDTTFGVHLLGEHQGGGGVAQIVEPDARASGPFEGWLERAAHHVPDMEGPAELVGEHEPGVLPL